eukprot:550682_1
METNEESMALPVTNLPNSNEMVELKRETVHQSPGIESELNETKINPNYFMNPLVDDYMDCQEQDIINCNAIKRILHLLQYYNTIQKNKVEICDLMHQHLLQFTNYNISLVMEDWYHCKKTHFDNAKQIEKFLNEKDIRCVDKKSCDYLLRYKRDRSRNMVNDYKVNKEIDYKKTILMDQLDSIHSYVFHSSLLARVTRTNVLSTNLLDNDHESESDRSNKLQSSILSGVIDEIDNNKHEIDIKSELEHDVWQNKPHSISQCNTAQIASILNETDIMNNLHKLSEFKSDIINYMKENEFDGEKIINM